MPASGARTTRFGIRTEPMWKGSVRAGDGMRLLALRVAAFRSGVRGRRGVRRRRGGGAVDGVAGAQARAGPRGERPGTGVGRISQAILVEFGPPPRAGSAATVTPRLPR